MAAGTIRGGKKGPTSVPQPESARFVLGSRPAVVRSPALDRIKPKAPETRDYTKLPPLAGNTGQTGLT